MKFPKNLKNRYFAFRHGESEANVNSIIVSNPSIGTIKYGLTEKGRIQVNKSISKSNVLNSECLIFSSDFKRTLETAEIIKANFKIDSVVLTPLLRERFFGDFDMTPNSNYDKIWKYDHGDPDHTKWNVESVNSVLNRTTQCITEIEQYHSGKTVILVSHGDALQILQTAFLHSKPSLHRELRHLQTAELRELSKS